MEMEKTANSTVDLENIVRKAIELWVGKLLKES